MSKLKYIPTKTIKTILNENYTRGTNGHDYEEVKEELEAILWQREAKLLELNTAKQLKEFEQYELGELND